MGDALLSEATTMVAQAARNSPRGEAGVGILYITDAACYCSSRYKAMRDSVKNIIDHMCARSVVLLIPPAKPSVEETGEEVFSEFISYFEVCTDNILFINHVLADFFLQIQICFSKAGKEHYL